MNKNRGFTPLAVVLMPLAVVYASGGRSDALRQLSPNRM